MAGGDPIPLDQTDDYSITTNDLGTWISLDFSSSQSLLAGTTYRISIGSYIHPSDTVGIDMGGLGEYSAQGIWDENDVFEGTNGPQWWTISDIPMLRMNFDPSSVSDITEVKETIFNVFPNPTSDGMFTINLEESERYDLTVSNVLGQTVYSNAVTTQNTIVDLSEFDKGIYTIELRNKFSNYTEKVVVE